jgi:hypothetical protein
MSLEQCVHEAHAAHYVNSPTGLVDVNDAPNSNIIYHLYDDGEVTQQKGGVAYGMRTEFTIMTACVPHGKYTFPLARNQHTYAVLTLEECERFRTMMST